MSAHGQKKIRCLRCRRIQDRREFPKGPLTGHQRLCETCRAAGRLSRKTRQPRISGAVNHADYHLRDRYGITLAERNEMIERQGGLCALCEERPATQVDHDHEFGKVRAILCLYCNAALGAFKDDPVIIRRAVDYLRRGDAYA